MLSLGEQTLLQRALQTASAAASTVMIVGAKTRYAGLGETIEDVYRGCGPLGGIHAALSTTDADRNLVLSVDMPLMTSPFLRWLIEQATGVPEQIVVPDAAGVSQPLCAVYRRDVREAVERALQRGDYKIGRLFSQVPTRVIAQEEIAAAGFSPDIFRNVNTPEEYDKILRLQTGTQEQPVQPKR